MTKGANLSEAEIEPDNGNSLSALCRTAWWFSEPARVRLLCLMHRFGWVCVADARKALGIPQQTLARHACHLYGPGVTKMRDGQTVYYRLENVSGYAACLLEIASQTATATADAACYAALLATGELHAAQNPINIPINIPINKSPVFPG